MKSVCDQNQGGHLDDGRIRYRSTSMKEVLIDGEALNNQGVSV